MASLGRPKKNPPLGDDITASVPQQKKMTDAEIIAAYPNDSPQDLLTKRGLSEEGFENLVEHLKFGRPVLPAVPQYAAPQKSYREVLQPVINTPQVQQQTAYGMRDVVRLVPVGVGGVGSTIPRHRAIKLMQKYPGQYKIV